MLKQYKPALLFLGKFLGVYFVLNIAYGFWYETFSPLADPITYFVTSQTIWVLDFFYTGLSFDYYPYEPLVWMSLGNQFILNAFEGCNGINVMILFLAFIVAYKGPLVPTLMYMVGGIIVIHLANIFRIAVLFIVAERYHAYLYFTHKYLFTGIIYTVVFLIWYVWVKRANAYNKELLAKKNA